jgi:hypothetical protein
MRGGHYLLFVSWLLISIGTIALFLFVPALTGNHKDPNPFHFLPYLPGIAIATIAGSTGGMFSRLFAVWSSINAPDSRQIPSARDPALFYLPPVLGAFAGVLTFLILAAGGLSLIEPTAAFSKEPLNTYNIGLLVYLLTPTSPGQFAIFVIYTTIAGYFFPSVPQTLSILKEHLKTSQ